ncbi:MAG: DUF2344 domain-containing protein [Candidatus Hydrogenedentes bacterium]|nr:DUF2344 domain-containing protein [Candidatus Hydrogenedentota bacterium]
MRVKLARDARAGALSHQEYIEALQEAVMRSELPVARSGGSAPRFRITSGPPLRPGQTSRCEYVDFEMCRPLSGAEFGRRLAETLPAGIELVWQKRLPAGALHLMACVESLSYEIGGQFDPQRAALFNAAEHWPATRKRTKKEQTFDLKRSVTRLDVHPGGLSMRITVLAEGTPKPEDVLVSVFGMEPEEAQHLPMERTAITLKSSSMANYQRRLSRNDAG